MFLWNHRRWFSNAPQLLSGPPEFWYTEIAVPHRKSSASSSNSFGSVSAAVPFGTLALAAPFPPGDLPKKPDSDEPEHAGFAGSTAGSYVIIATNTTICTV